MKRITAFISALLLVLVFSFNVFSFRISHDGIDNGTEWLKAETISLLPFGSHSNIDKAFLKYYVDYDSYDIWMLIQLRDSSMEYNDEDIKIIIFAENEEITINPSEEYAPVNEDKYTVDAKSVFDNARGMSSEIKLGIKNGIPDEYKFRIQFADSNGTLSNIRDITIKNPESSTTTKAVETEAEKETTKKTTTTTTKKERTTKEKTTKMRTTKATTIKVTTTKVTTTKPPKTTKTKTTKPTKTTKVTTAKADNKHRATDSAISSEQVTTSNIETTSSAEATTAAVSETLSASEKYKTIIFASGAVALILIAALSALNAKKKED